MLPTGSVQFLNTARLVFDLSVSCRRKAMKGRLYFATKAQKDGKILIKTHPCAQIFCCDICGFEKVICFINIRGGKVISWRRCTESMRPLDGTAI